MPSPTSPAGWGAAHGAGGKSRARAMDAASWEALTSGLAVWNLLIRPPRSSYHTAQLGPMEFTAGDVAAVRRDFHVRTKRGIQLACSQFTPKQDLRASAVRKLPVLVYLHGNSSSRLEAFKLVPAVVSQGFSLFCYDAAGCGHSDGEYVSLGYHEAEDLASVVQHLRCSPLTGPIGLWGRSMGAVTALLYVDRDPQIGAVLLDSPFSSLRVLVEEVARDSLFDIHVPSWLVGGLFALIRLRVKMLADFDVEDIAPVEHARRSFVPALFLHGKDDSFIAPRHSREIFEAYSGDKELLLVDGDHNTERAERWVQRSLDFFQRALRLEQADLRAWPQSLEASRPLRPLEPPRPLPAPLWDLQECPLSPAGPRKLPRKGNLIGMCGHAVQVGDVVAV